MAAEECWDVEIVGGDVLADFADVLLDLVDDVGQRVLHRFIWNFAAGFPGLGQERLLLVDVFLIGVLEAGGDDGDLDTVLHVVILHGAKDDVGIFVRGFLDDAGGFVNFMQRQAGTAGNIDEDALRALDRVVLEKRAGDGAVGGVHGAVRACPSRRSPGRA